jgi:hypothetical protein
MQMDRLKEHQLTIRATRRPIEFNYTNADIHHINTEPHRGYQFEYPVQWTGDQSTQKVIGIRRISYKPSSIDLAVTFIIEEGDTSLVLPIVLVFTDQNTFEECINRLILELNEQLEFKQSNTRCIGQYNKELGTFRMRFDDGTKYRNFKIEFNYGNDYGYNGSDAHYNEPDRIHYKSEFLKLFNQQITKENIDKLWGYKNIESMAILTYHNVWNRDSFYCHASFSDSPKQIIGINHDFWMSPSVFYDYSDNSNDFNIYFTTDTVHRILPRNGILLIQLSYIFNYQNSILHYA